MARGTDVSGIWDLELGRGRTWRIGPRPAILGILNCTPDSFSDGGRYASAGDAVLAGRRLLVDGADALDIGGESTRPGAEAIEPEEQIRRVVPVIAALRAETDCPISIDTRDPEVARAALEAGADIVNDVAELRDPGWPALLAERPEPVVLMHSRGTPTDMQSLTSYPRGVVTEVLERLTQRLEELEAVGIARERVIVDPGVGFAKDAGQNLELLRELRRFSELDRPLLFGASRKLFLGRILAARGEARGREPIERDIGTVAANVFAAIAGAAILRVHNVAYTRDAMDVVEALEADRPTDAEAARRRAEDLGR